MTVVRVKLTVQSRTKNEVRRAIPEPSVAGLDVVRSGAVGGLVASELIGSPFLTPEAVLNNLISQ
jgi:hypothetical protein